MSKPPLEIDIDAQLAEVSATVGYVPAALIGAFGERLRDVVDHHKKSVIKRARTGFTSRDRAARMIASRLFGYGSKSRPEKLADLQGESFAAGRDNTPVTTERIRLLERGGTQGGGVMVVPIGRGRPFRGVFANLPLWRKVGGGVGSFADRGFGFFRAESGEVYMTDERSRSVNRAAREGSTDPIIVGILRRKVQVPAVLGFGAEFDRIWPKHAAQMAGDVDAALTSAGRVALKERGRSLAEGRAAWAKTYRRHLDANPRKFAEARRVANQARRDVSRRNLAPKGRV